MKELPCEAKKKKGAKQTCQNSTHVVGLTHNLATTDHCLGRTAPCVCRSRKISLGLDFMHVDDAGEGLDGGADLGIDAETAGQGQFDLAARQVEHDHDAAAAARLA